MKQITFWVTLLPPGKKLGVAPSSLLPMRPSAAPHGRAARARHPISAVAIGHDPCSGIPTLLLALDATGNMVSHCGAHRVCTVMVSDELVELLHLQPAFCFTARDPF